MTSAPACAAQSPRGSGPEGCCPGAPCPRPRSEWRRRSTSRILRAAGAPSPPRRPRVTGTAGRPILHRTPTAPSRPAPPPRRPRRTSCGPSAVPMSTERTKPGELDHLGVVVAHRDPGAWLEAPVVTGAGADEQPLHGLVGERCRRSNAQLARRSEVPGDQTLGAVHLDAVVVLLAAATRLHSRVTSAPRGCGAARRRSPRSRRRRSGRPRPRAVTVRRQHLPAGAGARG